jgi:hypothetical protein
MMNVDLRSYAIIACLLLACHARSSLSARADEPEPVARNIQFVLQDEPYVTRLPDDYQPQEDLRYAAIVRGFAPLLISIPGGGEGPDLRPLDGSGLSAIAWLDSSRSGTRLRKLVEKGWLQHRLKATLVDDYGAEIAAPGGRHVAIHGHLGTAINLFRNAPGMPRPSSDFWRTFIPAQEMARPPLQEYALLASSVEEAKQFAADFLHAYDQGFVPWLQKLARGQKAALEDLRDKTEPKLAELDKKIASVAKEVEGVEELGDQAVSDLKVKRTLLKVELAGVEARASAIEEKLKEAGAAPQGASLHSKLVDLKVSADIERASLGAQRRVLDELIDGQGRLRELGQLQQRRGTYVGPMGTVAEGLPRCDEILADLKPFQLIGETVAIRPLRFQSE